MEVLVDPDLSCPALFGPGGQYSIATTDQIQKLRDQFQSHHKKITAFCLNTRFDVDAGKETEITVAVAKAAAMLGVPAIRIDLVPTKMADKPDEFMKLAIRVGQDLIRATDQTKVRFGVENHGHYTNRPEVLRQLFEGVGSKRFGLTMDIGNFYWFGHPLSKLYDLYGEFAPWSCHTHCKSIHYPEEQREKQREMGWKYGDYVCTIYEGDIDYGRLIEILRKKGYTGGLCVEDEALGRFPKDQIAAILQKEVKFLRKLSTVT